VAIVQLSGIQKYSVLVSDERRARGTFESAEADCLFIDCFWLLLVRTTAGVVERHFLSSSLKDLDRG